jgi:hypothetical protein
MRKFALRPVVVAAAVTALASAGIATDALARASSRYVQPGGDRGGGYVTETWPETGEYVDTTATNCSWLGGGHRSAYICR